MLQDLNYNTQRGYLRMPEYGRNVQRMVEYCMSVADREERNRVARAIILVMGQLNPHLRDVEDYRHKLWSHLFIISDFQLDVDSPYPKPQKEDFTEKPDRLTYPRKNIKFGHYGKNIELLIKKATEFEEGPEKQALILAIANLMKRHYLTWNRDTVTDEIIFEQLEQLSDGAIKLNNVTLTANVGNNDNRQHNNNKKRWKHNKNRNKKRY